MALRYYTSEELSVLLGISDETFHRKVKKMIKRDFKNELQELRVKNPDIMLDEKFRMSLADPRDHNHFYTTNLEISSYI